MRPSAHSVSCGRREKGCLHPPSLGKRPLPSSSPCCGPGGCSAAETAHVTGSSSSDQLQLCSKTSTISSVAGCWSLPPLHPARPALPAMLADHSLAAPQSPASIPAPGCWGPAPPGTGHAPGSAARGLCLWDPACPRMCGRTGMERDPRGTRGGPEPGAGRWAKGPLGSGPAGNGARRGSLPGLPAGARRARGSAGGGAGSGRAPGRSPRAWAGSAGGAPGRGRRAPSSCCCCRRRRCAPT